ncbi:MAG: beta-ketoacyl synthase, partial [Desulfobacterales bacterium]|nr:beta-ketoacyl synthase [Desulfobacterales bacterium]
MNFKHPEIAVVAMSGIFPGAGNTERFITNILNKKETVIKVPDHRWAARPEIMVSQSSGTAYQDTALSDRAGLITDFQFDSSGLNIDKALLAELDPVHHLVLSAGRQLFEECSLAKKIRKRTGVILAAIALPTPGSSKFSRELFLSPTPAMPTASTALGASMLSAPGSMLSRAFGLSGGCYTLDAACASSLFAIKLACERLVTGKADAMVAGGVSRPES